MQAERERSDRLGLLIVEGETLLREMLSTVLSRHTRLRVLGAAPDGETALRMASDLNPHVVLLNADLKGRLDAMATARAIIAQRQDTGLVLLASQGDRGHLAALSAMKAAGWAYLARGAVAGVAGLVRAIESTAAGLVVLGPAGVEDLHTRRGTILQLLTPRQQEVLSLMAEGLSNIGIARALVLEGKSVENHINAVFNQLLPGRDPGFHPRVKAVLTYLQESGNGAAYPGGEKLPPGGGQGPGAAAGG